MEEQDIKELFYEEVNKRGVDKKLGATKDQVYRWRHTEDVSIAAMLEVLWKLDKLEFKLE